MLWPTRCIGIAYSHTASTTPCSLVARRTAACARETHRTPLLWLSLPFDEGRVVVLMLTSEWCGGTTHWALTVRERTNQLRTQLPDKLAVGGKRQSRRVVACPPVIHHPRVGHGDVHKVLKERHIRAVVLPMQRTEGGQSIGLVDTAAERIVLLQDRWGGVGLRAVTRGDVDSCHRQICRGRQQFRAPIINH